MSRVDHRRHARHGARRSCMATAARAAERGFGLLCALAMVIGPLAVPAASYADDEPAPQQSDAAQTEATPRVPATDVTVMAFQQSWNTIAAECANIYGPSGVKYVQISPPAESVTGTEWWTVYQPVSYRLDSRFGTQGELASMIQACNTAGVQVVADVELNNTTDASVSWVDDQVGVAGTPYNGTYGRYPAFESSQNEVTGGLYRYKDNGNNHQYGITTKDFHDCTTNVKNFKDVPASEIWDCRQETRWDLNTSDARVQAIQADYLFRLWQLGVRGFRVSSAKYMDPADIASIKAALVERIGAEAAKELRFTQEVVYHQGEIAQIQADQYVRNGQVEEFRFAYDMLAALNGDADRLRTLTDGFIDGDDATVFVANWNTVRGAETLDPSSGARYELANAFMLANDYGEPMILSDYHFDNATADLAPQGTSDTRVPDVDMQAQCAATAGTASSTWTWGSWHCQPYWTSTRGMIEFHNTVHGSARTNWQQPSANNIGFARTGENGEDVGFFALNNTLVAADVTYTTTLDDGTYCNVYATSRRNCDERHRITVKDGRFTTQVPARGAVAIHAGARYDADADDAATGDRGPVYGEETADVGRIADRTLTVYVPQSAVPAGGTGLSVRITDANGAELCTVPLAAVDGRTDWLAADIKDVNTQAVRMSIVDGTGTPVLAPEQGWYDLGVGATIVWVDATGAHMGTPFVIGDAKRRTTLTVHAPTDALTDARGVSVLAADGTQERYCAFEQVDGASDRRVACELDGIRTEVRFRLVTADGQTAAAAGTQREYTASAQDQVVGSIEAWIGADGSIAQQSPEVRAPSATPQPNDQKNPQQLTVTVHYYRPDGNYQEYDLVSDVWYGWDLWTWASETDSGGMQRFTGHDTFGEIATYTLTQNQQGIRKPEFLVRQGGDAWMSKDPDDEDRLLPESAIVVQPGQSATGTAEIWLVAGDRTIYTVEPQIVGVTFDTQGGGRVPAQALAVGSPARTPAETPTRNGYVFDGWTADAAGTRPYDFATPVQAPTTVYARWTPVVTVTFAPGYEQAPDAAAPAPVVLAKGGKTIITQRLEREGYDFVGWTTASGGTVGVGDTLVVEADTTLTAQWKAKEHEVTFDANGGGFGDGQTPDAGAGTKTVLVEHGAKAPSEAAPSVPPGEGMRFVGWTTERDGAVSYDFDRPVVGALTLYAKWAEKDETFHQVTLHYHDGEDGSAGAVGQIFAKAGKPLTLTDPERVGHRFDGWAATEGGGRVDPLPTVDGDLTLHARWVKTWTVTFCDVLDGASGGDVCADADGAADAGTRLVGDATVDDGALLSAALQDAVPDAAPQRAGYRLVGWSTQRDGAQSVVDPATPVTGDMRLYAVWQKAGPQWTIRFDLNGGTADPAIEDARVYDGDRLRNPVMGESQKPKRAGYTFQGWSTVKNDALCLSVFRFDANGDSIIPIDRNGTLYAVWTPNPVRAPAP